GVEKQRAADPARGGGRGGTKKRPAGCGGRLRKSTASVPGRIGAGRRARADTRDGCPARASRQDLTHAVEKTTRRGRGGVFAGELADACIRASERLILHQRRLHERVDRVRRARRSVEDSTLGFRVAWRVFKLGEPVE